MKKSQVSIAKGTDPEKMLHDVLAPLGGIKNLIRPNATVVLKPNAGHPAPAESSVNTNPELVAAVIREVRKANPKEIIVAEAAAIGCDTMVSMEESGILKAAEEAGADKIIDIKSDKDLIKMQIRDARSDIKMMRLPRFLLEAEHIINLPIFKSHCSMVFTCALKNIKGVVQDKVHYHMHQTNLAEAMMDLWTIMRPDLNIADLIRPAEGFGPHTTMPVDFGCLVASRDPVALDATACRMVGLGLDKVEYFEPAYNRGLGNFQEESIEILGERIEDVHKPLWFPYLDGVAKYPEYEIDTEGACSSCMALVGLTMEKLKSLDQYKDNTDAKIYVGKKRKIPDDIPPDKLILVGDCLKRFKEKGVFIDGCPPAEPSPHWAIVDRAEPVLTDDDGEIMPSTRERMGAEGAIFVEHMNKLKKEFDEAQNNK